ncbi:hypothetical protein BgiMline_002549, partial [Biomphalaria glabrata]
KQTSHVGKLFIFLCFRITLTHKASRQNCLLLVSSLLLCDTAVTAYTADDSCS